jgi:hypothetical protein
MVHEQKNELIELLGIDKTIFPAMGIDWLAKIIDVRERPEDGRLEYILEFEPINYEAQQLRLQLLVFGHTLAVEKDKAGKPSGVIGAIFGWLYSKDKEPVLNYDLLKAKEDSHKLN